MKTVSFRCSIRRCLLALAAALCSLPLPAQVEQALQASSFPAIVRLQRGDGIFDQLAGDLKAYYQARARGQTPPALTLARYTVAKGETFFTVCARLNLPHSSLASLNHLGNPARLREGQELIVPNLPGIFLSETPKTNVENLLAQRLRARADQATPLHFSLGAQAESFLFFPSEDFSPQERRAFLGALFIPPLAMYRVSSGFGPRRNPISGQLIHHDGLDMVAPSGTAVLAAADGVVSDVGSDPVYGNFVIVDHGAGYESVYGHLRKFQVRKGQAVVAGTPIGQVGMTGQTTGPHLHFEIHYNGVARDPATLFQHF